MSSTAGNAVGITKTKKTEVGRRRKEKTESEKREISINPNWWFLCQCNAAHMGGPSFNDVPSFLHRHNRAISFLNLGTNKTERKKLINTNTYLAHCQRCIGKFMGVDPYICDPQWRLFACVSAMADWIDLLYNAQPASQPASNIKASAFDPHIPRWAAKADQVLRIAAHIDIDGHPLVHNKGTITQSRVATGGCFHLLPHISSIITFQGYHQV